MFAALERAQQKTFPGVVTLPVMLTGATDSAQLRQKGAQAYGLGSVATDQDRARVHGNDERLSIEGLGKFVEFLYRAVTDVAAARGSHPEHVVDDPPGRVHVVNAQPVATRANRGHRSRMRHAQQLTTLQSPQQVARLNPGRLGEGRRLDFAAQPDERFVGRVAELPARPSSRAQAVLNSTDK
jgi:hypothetical protein